MNTLRRSIGGMAIAIALFAYCGKASAEDASDLKEQIADLKTKVAAMESSQFAPSAGGDAKSLTSMKKNGSVTIGGDIKVDVVVLNRDEGVNSNAIGNATKAPSRRAAISDLEGDSINSTMFSTGQPYGAYLDFKINASPDVFLYIKLDLDDNQNSVTRQDDLLEEAYFRWNHVRGSNWDFAFGKKKIDYGKDRYDGITPSFQDGWAWWLSGIESAPSDGSRANAHNAVGSGIGLPTAYYHVFQAEAIYSYKDMAKFYFTVFQNNDTTGTAGRLTRGMHEDRSNDSLFFQSWSAKAELMPIEGLTLQASFVNYHNSSKGDSQMRRASDLSFSVGDANNASDSQMASSLSFDYEFRGVPIDVWGEWQHGFDWGYNDNTDTDTLSLGALWNVTEAIDLSLMGEWAGVNNATERNLKYNGEDYYQVVMNATYTFPSGIYMMAEYAHVWYDAKFSDRAAAPVDSYNYNADADMFGFRMGWKF